MTNAPGPIDATCSKQAAGYIIVTICIGIAGTEDNAITPNYLEMLPGA